VALDSRKAVQGSLFVALPGERTSGARFVEAAFENGASGALVSEADAKAYGLESAAAEAGRVLVVAEDALRALQDAAASYLGRFPRLRRVGITGSSGKTTTKEIAASILGRGRKVVMNEGNLNSESGLPLAVFSVREGHEAGIFEMGMNRRGEIAELASVLCPQLALITNIGTAHIGILGSKRAIAEEKRQIFSQFSVLPSGGTALIPADDEYRDFLAEGVKGKTVFYGRGSLEGLGGIRPLGLDGWELVYEGVKCRFPLPGEANLKNAVSAIALALEAGSDGAAVRAGLEGVRPLFGRGEILRGPGRPTVLRDCYNSNPESLAQAVAFCDGLDGPGRKIYVAGAMLERGEASEREHREAAAMLAASKADIVFLFGGEFRGCLDGMPKAAKPEMFSTDDIAELKTMLKETVKNDDFILLKGSRGCALERVTDVLAGGAAHVS
jgi:UDP-N-acetylmuramoyl-tripeptide--D-alanyl-D-alanine ligase